MIDSFGHTHILWSGSGPLVSTGTVSLSLSDRNAEEGGAPEAMKQSLATSFLIQGPHPPPRPTWWVRGVLPICAYQAKAATPRTTVLNGGYAAPRAAGDVITNGGHKQPWADRSQGGWTPCDTPDCLTRYSCSWEAYLDVWRLASNSVM